MVFAWFGISPERSELRSVDGGSEPMLYFSTKKAFCYMSHSL
jgi:hypothetical protein